MVKSLDERITFHEFWLWEYQRRNSEYKETYDNFMRKLSLIKIDYREIVALPEKKSSKFSKKNWEMYRIIVADRDSFIKKFDRDPKDYKEGYDSENILQTILSGKENSLFLPYAINGILMSTELPIYDRVGGYTEWPHLTVRLDLTKDLDLLLKEVESLYYEFHLKKKTDSTEYSGRKNIDEIDKIRKESLEKLLKFKKGLIKQGSPKALPRAAGLWLWDRWVKKGKDSENKVIQRFFDEVTEQDCGPYFSNEKKISLISDEKNRVYMQEKQLLKILKKTTDCIKEVKVLSMK
jgi:hypothetical protein